MDHEKEMEEGPTGTEAETESESWAPWGAFSDLQEAVGGMVDSALRNVNPGGARFPRYDLISIPGEGYRALIDLPGLEKGDVDLTVADRALTIAGERGRPELPEGGEVQRSERPYGNFQRTLRIPDDADATGIGAKMTNGVLEVTLPFRGAGEAQRIDVE